MKKIMLLMALTGALVSNLEAKVKKGKQIEIKKMSISYEKAPSIDGGKSSLKSSNKAKWLKILVEYETLEVKKNDLSKNNKLQRFLEDFTLEYNVALIKENKFKALFSGSVTYDFVSFDGKKHFAIALLPPQVYQKSFFQTEYKYSDTDLKDFIVTVQLKDKNGKVRSIAYSEKNQDYKIQDLEKAVKIIKGFDSKLNKLPRDMDFRDTILGRNKTPWAFVNYDDFEMIKEGR